MPRRDRDTADPNVRISKKLSWILRHGAEKEGFKLMKGGFLYVEDILKHRSLSGATVEQIRDIVESNDKKRFTLETEEGTERLKICANQGHSLQIDDLDLKPIDDASEFPVVVHGTNPKAYRIIETEGLKPMGRNHVHFATGEPGEDGVISGMRNSCTVVIYLNLTKAIEDGIKFYLSANNVILSPGNENGVILPIYFDKVKNRRSGNTQRLHQTPEQHMEEPSSSGASPLESSIPVTMTTAVTADELADEMDQKKRTKKKNKQ